MDTEWFKARKKELKLSDERVGAAIGRDRSIANRIVTGRQPLDLAHVPAFAAIFQVSREEILARAGVLPSVDPALLSSNGEPFRMEGASLNEPRPNLPIYGAALGASKRVDGDAVELTTLNRGEVIEYAKRPPLLNKRLKAYGLYVQGSSMHPALPDGEMVAVVPDMPLAIGDLVVLYLRPDDPNDDDGETARAVLIKELVRRTASQYILRQYQPAADFSIDIEQVVRVDRVLSRKEMLS